MDSSPAPSRPVRAIYAEPTQVLDLLPSMNSQTGLQPPVVGQNPFIGVNPLHLGMGGLFPYPLVLNPFSLPPIVQGTPQNGSQPQQNSSFVLQMQHLHPYNCTIPSPSLSSATT